MIHHEDVQTAAEGSQRFGNRLLRAARGAEVAAHRRHDVRFGRRFAGAIPDGDFRAGPRQQQGRRASNSSTTASHKGPFAGEIDHRCTTLHAPRTIIP